MPVLLLSLGLLMAAVVKTDQTPLRSGCSEYDFALAKLPQGTALSIRYAVSGESVPCYKVSAETDGKTVNGFLPASAIDGLEDFDKARRAAAWLDTAQVMEAVRAAVPVRPEAGSVAKQADQLIESNHPLKALELLETELKTHRNADLLALAGLAA